MNNHERITIGNEEYLFIKNYKHDTAYRSSLNRLAKATYGFDFEEWYQRGFWGDRYRPYSLVHNHEIVANISVNPIDFWNEGRICPTLQIGTVMTAIPYRKKGLSRELMNIVLSEYEPKYDMIYLYANDTVLDFYPKFGFIKEEEYIHTAYRKAEEKRLKFQKLKVRETKDQELLLRLIKDSKPSARYTMLNNPGLMMFYFSSFLSENIYYCEELALAAVVELEEGRLGLIDVFCEKDYDLQEVINSLMTDPEMEIRLGFTPISEMGFRKEPLRDAGTTFFFKGKNYLKQGRFPELSHA